MATQISCGAVDCGNNSGAGASPTCMAPQVRITKGKMGGAICHSYTNAPDKKMQHPITPPTPGIMGLV